MDRADYEKAREWLEAWVSTGRLAPALIDSLAVAESRFSYYYPHMCRDGHEEVGFAWDEERCPVCKVRDDLLAEVRRVIEDECPPIEDIRDEYEQGANKTCRAILRRLEGLK